MKNIIYNVEINTPETEFYSSERQLIELWEQASDIFKNYPLPFEDNNFELHTDFSDLFVQAKKNNCFWGGNLKISVISKKPISNNNLNTYNFIVLTFIDTLFICLNLSLPGSMNMLKMYVTNTNGFNEKIKLSSTHLERTWEISKSSSNWPKIQNIPLSKVHKWYKSLNIGSKIIAETNIEKSLFSILDICHYDYNENPSLIVWITQGLEAFYDVKNGEPIVKSLKRRLILHLGESVESKKLNKRINDFYAYRSSFVHGEMKILRLGSHKFLWNDKTEGHFYKLWALTDFGLTLLISSIQKLILNESQEINFTEQIEYK